MNSVPILLLQDHNRIIHNMHDIYGYYYARDCHLNQTNTKLLQEQLFRTDVELFPDDLLQMDSTDVQWKTDVPDLLVLI